MARSLYFICILYFFCMLLSFHWKVLCFFSCVKFTCFYWSSNTYSIVYRLNWMCCFTEEFCLQNEGEGNSGGPRTDGLQGWIFQRVHQIFTSDLLEDCFNSTGEGQHQSDAWSHAKVLLSSIKETLARCAGWTMQESLELTGYMQDRWLYWVIQRCLYDYICWSL